MGTPLTGRETIAAIRAKHSRTLLAFSRGKDAIAAWLAIRDAFEEVIPYCLFTVPGLEFEEESLDYYERFFGTKIVRLPHPSMYRYLTAFVFQPPERCLVIEQSEICEYDYKDVLDMVCSHRKIEDKILAADGVRAADSPMRRLAIMTHGPISWANRRYHPVWDWKKDDLLKAFRKSGVKLPIDYDLFGRTFDGLDLRFLLPLKKNRPRDYQRVLDWYPLAELEVFRWECAQRGR